MMIHMKERAEAVIVAVSTDAAIELENMGLAFPLPVLRGVALDAAVTVGMDAAALVTLLQAPDSVRAFASWLRDRCVRSGDSIEVKVRHGDRRLHLTIDGDIGVDVVMDFLAAALTDCDPES
jgi:hypothetical protein